MMSQLNANTTSITPSTTLQMENEHLKQENRWMQDILAFTGHELRNHLTRLRLTSEKLSIEARPVLPENQQATLDQIRHSVKTLNLISQNYLNLALAEESALTACPTLVDPIRDIFGLLLDDYEGLLASRQLSRTVEISNPNLLLWADRTLLLSACDNLLNNAVKYSDQGGMIVITITERGTQDEISVWNSGPGIDLVQRYDLFERFSRGQHETDFPGSGIGLYLARKIVEAHGGSLWVESQPGAWANFLFTLPRRSSAQALARQKAPYTRQAGENAQ